MADKKLRRLERQTISCGDPESWGRYHWERVRCGLVNPDLLRVAAHLGDRTAQMVVGRESLCLKCDHTQTPCNRCNNTGSWVVDSGLIRTVQQTCPTIIPLSVIVNWACDCVDHHRETTGCRDRSLTSAIRCVREWLDRGCSSVNVELMGFITDTPTHITISNDAIAVKDLILGTRPGLQEGLRVRNFTAAVSSAYHASGNKKTEREWQVSCLLRHLTRT